MSAAATRAGTGRGVRAGLGTRGTGPPGGAQTRLPLSGRGGPGPAPPVGHPGCGGGAGAASLSGARGRGDRVAAGCWRLRCAPRPAPAGMAALLTPGPQPDEQDFIQAYEEVREKYKGTTPRPAAGPAAPDSPAAQHLVVHGGGPIAGPSVATPPASSAWIAPHGRQCLGKGRARSAEPPRPCP